MAFYDLASFNGTTFNSISGLSIDKIDLSSPPQEMLTSQKLMRRDGAKLYNREKGSRTITIEGHFTAAGREDYFASRNTLLKLLEGTEKVLSVPMDPNAWEFTATIQSTIFSDVAGGYAVVTMTFLCSDPYGYDRDRITIVNGTSNTDATDTVFFNQAIGGVYDTPPTITINVSVVTGGTAGTMTIGNQTGDSISIVRDWANDDVVVLDMKARTCKVNGASVDYNDTFWNISPGDVYITYDDDFTTRTVGYLVTYRRRY